MMYKNPLSPAHLLATLLVAPLGASLFGCSSSGGDESGGDAGATSSIPGGSGGANGSGGAATTGGAGSTTEVPAAGALCPRAERAGSFQLYLGENSTRFVGAAAETARPAAALPEVVASDGPCELLGPRSFPPCTPTCAGGEVCAEDGTCVPLPENVSAGTITLAGLLAPLSAEVNGITGGYSAAVSDPFPAFESGATVEATAAGDEFAAFTLTAYGVPQLTAPTDLVTVQSGSGATLTWDASLADPSQSAISINFNIDAHGANLGWIECTVPDTGSFEVPAALITQLIGLGTSGFPRAVLSRISADTVNVSNGCVELQVSSPITIDLSVDGVISCSDAIPCPTGMTCISPDLYCE